MTYQTALTPPGKSISQISSSIQIFAHHAYIRVHPIGSSQPHPLAAAAAASWGESWAQEPACRTQQQRRRRDAAAATPASARHSRSYSLSLPVLPGAGVATLALLLLRDRGREGEESSPAGAGCLRAQSVRARRPGCAVVSSQCANTYSVAIKSFQEYNLYVV